MFAIEQAQKIRTQKECILKFPGIESLNSATQLLDRKVAWLAQEHKIKGKIVALHGKKVWREGASEREFPEMRYSTAVDVIG